MKLPISRNSALLFVVLIFVLVVAGAAFIYIGSRTNKSRNESDILREINESKIVSCPLQIDECNKALVEDIPSGDSTFSILGYPASNSAEVIAVFDGLLTVVRDNLSGINTITITNEDRRLRAIYVYVADPPAFENNIQIKKNQVLGVTKDKGVLLRESYNFMFTLVDLSTNKGVKFYKINDDFPRLEIVR